MQVNVKQIIGNWDVGYSLDKHTISSVPVGHNEYGHMQFDTRRTELGEAMYQLKYKANQNQVNALAIQLVASLGYYFAGASFVIPMLASKPRHIQPVSAIAKQVALLMNILYLDNILVKVANTEQVKNIPSREERINTLCSAFQVNDVLADGKYNVLIVDDIYDTGSSLEAATIKLKQYAKINQVFVATITRKQL